MTEQLDKLLLRIILTLFICLVLFLYKYAHSFLYPSSRLHLFKRFYPSKNSAYTLHFFSRLIGMGIIFSEFYFHLSSDCSISYTILSFLLKSTLAFILYLASIYIIEGIVLYNFEYTNEILKRKNLSYALICFAHSLSLAFILKTILAVSKNSFIMLILLWLFTMTIMGLAAKSYRFISKLDFNKLLIQKNISMAFSYTGFFLGCTILTAISIDNNLIDLLEYSKQTALKILLSLIIFPVFRNGLIWFFRMKEDFDKSSPDGDLDNPEIGYGIYEGALFFTSCYLTSIISEHIQFGTFYSAP